MKICYIANVRLPTEKAHGIQIMKMCEAFALLGHGVELLVAKRRNPIKENAFDFYSIKPEARARISIKYISSPNLIFLGKIGFWLQTWCFAELASIKMRMNYPEVVYSRDEIILLNMYFIHPNLVWEAHRGNIGFAVKLLLKRAKLVTISKGLTELYSKFTNRILTAPDGVDLREFSISETKQESRVATSLPQDKQIFLYCGHLYEWKGAHLLADAARDFGPDELAVFVGGTDADIVKFREKNKDNKHILIVGRKPHNEIPLYLKSANALVLPNSAKEKMSSLYTSPLKLFEYMASGVPIVASDLPSLREILNEKTAVFFTPDDSASLLVALHKPPASDTLKEVQKYTWENRAKSIISFIEP